MHETFGAQYAKYLLLGFSYSHPFILVIKFLSAAGKGCNISLVVIGVRVRSLAVVPGFHLGGGGCRTGVHVGDGGAAVFGGQARHAAEAVVGVVGGDGTLRRLGQPVVLVIGIGPCAVGQGIAYGIVGDGLPVERRQQVRPIGVAVGVGAACCPDVAVKRRPRPSQPGYLFLLVGFLVLQVGRYFPAPQAFKLHAFLARQ